ncbi:beta-ketoacyl synthase N-terminal-like domain-containing protein, partial [Bacillus cereus]|nr:beta-ketoacyl synthase N-terminal-like domain-containing protein [Bacillus cereus]
MERVVITGMGVVSPIGNDIKTFWNNLIKGESGIVNIDTFDVTNHKTKIAGIVQDFDADEVLGKKEGNYSASSRRLFSFTSLICIFCVNTRYIRLGGDRCVE